MTLPPPVILRRARRRIWAGETGAFGIWGGRGIRHRASEERSLPLSFLYVLGNSLTEWGEGLGMTRREEGALESR